MSPRTKSPDDVRGRERVRAVAASLLLLTAAAAAAIALSRSTPPERVAAGRAAAPVADRCVLDARAHELALPVPCGERAVRIDGDLWSLDPGTWITRGKHGPELRRGRASFAIAGRAPDAPLRLRVDAGEIRATAGLFVIEQHERHGTVAVKQGAIEFVWNDGARERVAAGQSLRWPRPEPLARPQPAAAADAGPPHDAASARLAAELDRVLERARALREGHHAREAVALLRRTLREAAFAPSQRERVSYALGLALEASGLPACPHWQRHIELFAAGAHASALAERVARCRQP